jgi:hypothetical protein
MATRAVKVGDLHWAEEIGGVFVKMEEKSGRLLNYGRFPALVRQGKAPTLLRTCCGHRQPASKEGKSVGKLTWQALPYGERKNYF